MNAQNDPHLDAECRRLQEDDRRQQNWKRWGPYLSERQWGTVREDYSPQGHAWSYLTHDQARSRAYRWGEDGLLGITDRECRLCFALALWNGQDPILKERLFGLTNREGNHGEDVKEAYFYLDSTPTHSYLKALYKYPQAEFPYQRLVAENRNRSRCEREFELCDTGIFDEGRYFDVFVEYAKAGPNDILIRITVCNRALASALLHVLPTLWFRNTWTWGQVREQNWAKPSLRRQGPAAIALEHETLGRFRLSAGPGKDGQPPPLLFTENESNNVRLYQAPNAGPYVKDAFHEYVIRSRQEAVNPEGRGTKAALHYKGELAPGASWVIELRLSAEDEAPAQAFGADFARVFAERGREADAFHAQRDPGCLSEQERRVARQAYAGLLWSKQFYFYVVRDWLEGDPQQPVPPAGRLTGRNSDWTHVYCREVLCMPDKWEYPWFAAWDHAFHMLALVRVDPELAKQELILLLREWYMHANGQLPAYEYCFSDVNPPMHAWACLRVYQRGGRDRAFLERVFHKLLINFTWWVNRKDVAGKNLFAGGFLGLDNIGVIDRSQPLPPGMLYAQADGTAWMAFYCQSMLAIAVELAADDPVYEDVASKFFEHFVAIADAMNTLYGTGLWDTEDGFYYDGILVEDRREYVRVRSMVGLVPLFAVVVLDEQVLQRLPGFRQRLDWFLEHRPDLKQQVACLEPQPAGGGRRRLLAIPTRERLERILRYLVDENEFLSPYGIRSLSRYHRDHEYRARCRGREFRLDYEPAESTTGMFGGNSNWRGPVWFPVNYALIHSLLRYHDFYGDDLRVECPRGSGRLMNLAEVATEIATRLTRLFLPDEQGRRPCHGGDPRFAADPHWRDLVLFYEYFDGDNGRGCGASHQTGWTALVANLLHDFCALPKVAPAGPKIDTAPTAHQKPA